MTSKQNYINKVKLEPRLKCTTNPRTAGEWERNICAKSAGSSQAAATPGSFAVASEVLNGHLWRGESPCNDFLSGKEDWRVGRAEKHSPFENMKGVVGSGKTVNVHAFLGGKSPVTVALWSKNGQMCQSELLKV